MTAIKLCGLSTAKDIEAVNTLRPEFIGFVFAEKSRRYVSPDRAMMLRKKLDASIRAVGVFVRESPETVASLLQDGVIDMAQLHGGEDESYIERLRSMTDRPLIQAFRVDNADDLERAGRSTADYILLDSGAGGTGRTFDWQLIGQFPRPYFLAGGLNAENAAEAVGTLHPWGVDTSSGVETDGVKDAAKIEEFVNKVRTEEEQ